MQISGCKLCEKSCSWFEWLFLKSSSFQCCQVIEPTHLWRIDDIYTLYFEQLKCTLPTCSCVCVILDISTKILYVHIIDIKK